jgi:hypothetical protein
VQGILLAEWLNSGIGLVAFFVLDVALGVAVDGFEVLGDQSAAEFAGLAHEEAARGDYGAFRDKCASGDDAACADFGTVQDDAAHADQAARFDGAAVQDDGVAYGDVVAENQRICVAHHVKDGTVLNISTRADAHEVHVAAKHGARPHAGMFADDDVTDDHGLRVNVSSYGDLRNVA